MPTNLLTLARTSAGLTVAQLAKLTHIPQPALKTYEAGTRFCPIDKLCLIAAALRVNPEALMMKAAHPEQRPAHKSARELVMAELDYCGDRMSLLRLAVYRAEDDLYLAENADTFTTESNRAIAEATKRLEDARDALYAATNKRVAA